MKIDYFQVNTFTEDKFGGNPAGVCPLTEWLPDEVMLKIAAENNLSETAFFVPDGEDFLLRWFTPAVEIDLCGHGTMATAFVLHKMLGDERKLLKFHTHSGELRVEVREDEFWLNLPSRPPEKFDMPDGLESGLGEHVNEVYASRDCIALLDSEEDLREMIPDMKELAKVPHFCVIATAPGDNWDFVSRVFAPNAGVPEDPVTGSAHASLIPYWANKLGRNELKAEQLSARHGILDCVLDGDRVLIGGKATLFLKGQIDLSGAV